MCNIYPWFKEGVGALEVYFSQLYSYLLILAIMTYSPHECSNMWPVAPQIYICLLKPMCSYITYSGISNLDEVNENLIMTYKGSKCITNGLISMKILWFKFLLYVYIAIFHNICAISTLISLFKFCIHHNKSLLCSLL